jgi:hypothetical protein
METVIWNILRPFGKFCGHLVYFTRFGMFYEEKSGHPADMTFFSIFAGKLIYRNPGTYDFSL